MPTNRDHARDDPFRKVGAWSPDHAPTRFLDRRLFLMGGFGGLGLGLPRLLQAQAMLDPRKARSRIKACILFFCYGGPSHLETWDPKPNAPREVRGEFRTAA